MYNCAIPGCRRSYGDWCRKRSPLGPRPVMYHAKKTEKRALWEAAVNFTERVKNNKEWKRGISICDIHFTPEDFIPWNIRDPRCKTLPPHLQNVKLKRTAVPSLYIDEETNLAAKKKLKPDEWAWWELIPQNSSPPSQSVIQSKQKECSDLEPNVSQSSFKPKEYNFDISKGRSMSASEIGLRTVCSDKSTGNNESDQECSESSQLSAFLCTNTNQSDNENSSEVGFSYVELSDTNNLDDFTKCSNEENQQNFNNNVQSDSSEYISKEKITTLSKQDSSNSNLNSCHFVSNAADKSHDHTTPILQNKQKRKLFRELCSTPLKLPSHLWAVHYHCDNEYLIICKVSFNNGFCVDRGLRFTREMSQPDVYIGERKVIHPDMEALSNVSDIEKFISVIDYLLPCPGSGVQSLPFSKSCSGFARSGPCNASGIIPCMACNYIRISNMKMKMKEMKI